MSGITILSAKSHTLYIVLPSKITTTEWKMRCREHVHYFRAANDDCLVQKNSTKLPSKPLKVKDYIFQIAYFCPNISLKPKYIQFTMIKD